MFTQLLRLASVIMMLAVLPLGALAQDGGQVYEAGDSSFQVPIPDGWMDQSTDTLGHFLNADGTLDAYALAVTASDVQEGILAALKQVDPEFDAAPVQSSEVPLPNGTTWMQNIYVLPGGDVVAALGQSVEGRTYVLIGRAPQDVFVSENSTFVTMLLGFQVAGVELVTYQPPAYADPDAFTEYDVTVESGGWELPGTVTMPDGDGPFPAVVLVHGSGPNDRDETVEPNKPFRDLAWGLATQGIAVLRYDKRTLVYRGDFAADLYQATVQDETIDDALAAVKLLQATSGVDSGRVFVLGHSLGAMLAPRIAQQDSTIAGIIMLAAPSRSLIEVSLEQLDYVRTLPENEDEQAQAVIDQYISDLNTARDLTTSSDPQQILFGAPVAYWLDLQEYDQVEVAQQLDRPLLILQGERDYQVTMTDFAGWETALAGRDNVTLKHYPALNHLFLAGEGPSRPSEYQNLGSIPEEVIQDIAGWILSH